MNLYDEDEPLEEEFFDEEDDLEKDFEEYPLEYDDELQDEIDGSFEEELITDELDETYLNEEGFFIEEDEEADDPLEEDALDLLDDQEDI